MSLGINVSILLILTIFGVLLFLPLRLLFDTNYSDQDQNGDGNDVSDLADSAKEREPVIPMDHRKLRRCPNLQYEDRLMSVFLSDYDENCTYDEDECDDDEDDDDDDSDSEEEDSREDEEDEEKTCISKRRINEEMKENAEEILKTRQMKSVTVAGHILVTMLLVSVIAALIEVLRIRFAREKGKHDYLTEMLRQQRGPTRHKTSHFKRIN